VPWRGGAERGGAGGASSATDSESDAPSEASPDALVLEHYRAAVLELTRQALKFFVVCY
jgi:hypothetical protein